MFWSTSQICCIKPTTFTWCALSYGLAVAPKVREMLIQSGRWIGETLNKGTREDKEEVGTMKRIVILGSGGYGRTVADVAHETAENSV